MIHGCPIGQTGRKVSGVNMAMQVVQLREWLATLNDDQLVGVDDGGLCLRVVDDPEPYCEIGGLPEDEDD